MTWTTSRCISSSQLVALMVGKRADRHGVAAGVVVVEGGAGGEGADIRRPGSPCGRSWAPRPGQVRTTILREALPLATECMAWERLVMGRGGREGPRVRGRLEDRGRSRSAANWPCRRERTRRKKVSRSAVAARLRLRARPWAALSWAAPMPCAPLTCAPSERQRRPHSWQRTLHADRPRAEVPGHRLKNDEDVLQKTLAAQVGTSEAGLSRFLSGQRVPSTDRTRPTATTGAANPESLSKRL
jgi:hypothetical protein